MITFQRTSDRNLLTLVLTDPLFWPHITDDYAPDPRRYEAPRDPRIWYVLVIENCEVIGLFTFLPRSTVLWETHLVLYPDRKTRGTEILRQAFAWMAEHSTAKRFVAEIPRYNRLAVKLAGRVMQFLGVNEQSFQKDGRLEDLMLFGSSPQPN
jgi:hypothetical protein